TLSHMTNGSVNSASRPRPAGAGANAVGFRPSTFAVESMFRDPQLPNLSDAPPLVNLAKHTSRRNGAARDDHAKTKRARTGNRGRCKSSADRKLSDFRNRTTLHMARRARCLSVSDHLASFCA